MKSKLFLLPVVLALTACASGPNANPRDPLEPFNRGVYRFNDALDTAVLKPVATAYHDVMPSPVRQGVHNFFGNLQDVWSFVNNVLQLKGDAAGDSLARVGINTFIGLGGIFDIATDLKIERHTKDFGHTLGYWGLGPGPYIVLPLLGPSTLRDTVALPVDIQSDPVSGLSDVGARNSLTVLRVLDKRSSLLQASAMLEEAALDNYAFIREAYLQRRRSTIYDGNPPDDSSFDSDPESPEMSRSVADKATETLPETLKHAGIPEDQKVKP
jgi:phospholipid-binding lipoprotein MlaA